MAVLLYKATFPVKFFFLKRLRWENHHTPHNKKFIHAFSSFPIQFSFPVHWPQEYESSKISKAPGKTEAAWGGGGRRTVK